MIDGPSTARGRPDHRVWNEAGDHPVTTEAGDHRRLGRRQFLLAGTALGTGFLAGCSGGQSTDVEPPSPVSLGASVECDVCGMVVAEHPGPNGQIFYRDEEPATHGNPARFDSTKACLFPYYFDHEQLGWKADVVYVTDYSRVDYEISTVQGQAYIETATGANTFADARDSVFVVGSEVHGAMGPDFIPFSEADDGAAFADEFGGQPVAFDDVTRELLGR